MKGGAGSCICACLPAARVRVQVWCVSGKPRTSSLGGKPSAFCERLSQRSTELSFRRFDKEISRKSKAMDEQRYRTVLLLEYSSQRTSSTVVQTQVVGVCDVRTLADR